MSESDDGTEESQDTNEQPQSKGAAGRAERADLEPTRGSDTGEELAAAGETMASGLSGALDEDAPVEQRKEGVKQLGSLVSGILGGVMEYRDQKQSRKKERARQADLEETTDKPSCECGLTFTEIPLNAERVACPECGREYEVQ